MEGDYCFFSRREPPAPESVAAPRLRMGSFHALGADRASYGLELGAACRVAYHMVRKTIYGDLWVVSVESRGVGPGWAGLGRGLAHPKALPRLRLEPFGYFGPPLFLPRYISRRPPPPLPSSCKFPPSLFSSSFLKRKKKKNHQPKQLKTPPRQGL